MISNRQGGRRRGRGGQRNPNVGGQAGGNRQDNRQRGNAAQLLEKYKSMARDAQLSGDRVQMEYFLQYAEHYFRVLNENRSRFDEQRKQRGDNDADDSDEDDDGAETSNDRDDDEDDRQDERPQRRERPEKADRSRRVARSDRQQGNGSGHVNGGDERIAVEALPPAIGRDEAEQAEVSEDEAPRPRRARRPRPRDEGEIAPAA